MGDTFGTVLLGLVGLGVLAMLLWLLRSAWRTMEAQSERGLMARMLERQGAIAPDESVFSTEAAAYAVRRCARCRAVQECERFLATGDREGFEAFCPNANYILRHVRREPAEKAPAG